MNIVIVSSTTGQFYKDRPLIEEELRRDGHMIFFIFRKPGDEHNIMNEIRSHKPDVLVTEELEGFEMCTLTDAVSYNLIHCRQFHVIRSGGLRNERYLGKQLSLVMTFVCTDEDMAQRLAETYPDLPEVVCEKNFIM